MFFSSRTHDTQNLKYTRDYERLHAQFYLVKDSE